MLLVGVVIVQLRFFGGVEFYTIYIYTFVFNTQVNSLVRGQPRYDLEHLLFSLEAMDLVSA